MDIYSAYLNSVLVFKMYDFLCIQVQVLFKIKQKEEWTHDYCNYSLGKWHYKTKEAYSYYLNDLNCRSI